MARISIKPGDGGDGLVSFRREKYVPKGGPWGGDAGKGGNIIIKVDQHLNTLTSFKRKKNYKAENGRNGMKNLKKGRDGKTLVIKVPAGTIIRDENGQLLYDLTNLGEEVLIATGGRGGLGNWHFKSSINRTPRQATSGVRTSVKILDLELKLIADVGLVGLPSSGKSTLLNAMTHTNVKTAEYHFTTLEPNLGVLEGHEIVIADIPGLIEGASEGKGLGHDFLRHVERTKLLIHIIDGADVLFFPLQKLLENYQVIQDELCKWNTKLVEKPQIVVINKCDLSEVSKNKKKIKDEFKRKGISKLFFISSATSEGLEKLIDTSLTKLKTINNDKEDPIKKIKQILTIENLKNRRIVFKTTQQAVEPMELQG